MNSREESSASATTRHWGDFAVAEVMTTPVVTVTPQTSVRDVIRLLLNEAISGMPVVEADGSIVGIVTEKDLLVGGNILAADVTPVSLVMNHKVTTVGPEATLDEVAETMVHLGYKRLPVVSDGMVAGVISRCDVLRIIEEHS